VIRPIAVFDGTARRVRVMLTARFCQRDRAIRKRMRVGERNAAIVCPGRRRRWTDRLLIKGKRSLPLPYFRLCVGFCISAGGPKRCGTSPRRRAATSSVKGGF
jgi:hypothetical protein